MSSLASLANLFDTPINALYKGVPIYCKSASNLNPSVKSTRIMSDAFGFFGARKGDVGFTLDLDPIGDWSAAVRNLLHPYTTLRRGMPIGPTIVRVPIADINLTTNVLTYTAHGFADGDSVRVGSTSVILSPLVAGTEYFIDKVSDDTFKICSDSGLTVVDLATTSGAQSLTIVRDNPLDLYLLNYGQKLRIHNAALVGIPDLQAGATSTPFGKAKFEGFLRGGYAPGTTGSYYTISEADWSDTSLDPANILTQPLTVALGSSAPFNDLNVGDAVKVGFDLKTTEVRCDQYGLRGRKLDDIAITATITPRGVSAYQALSKVAMETARGATRDFGTLNLSGTNFYFRGYATDIEEVPHVFGGADDLLGAFKVTLLRTITAGAADARYYVGADAPA